MSSGRYRDDSLDTARASSSVWGGLTQMAEDIALVAGTLTFALLVGHSDLATAADAVSDRTVQNITDGALASDAVMTRYRARQTIAEAARVADRAPFALRVLHADVAQVGESLIDSTAALSIERATLAEAWQQTRTVHALVAEVARAGDVSGQFAKAMLADVALAADAVPGRSHARVMLADVAHVADDLQDTHQATASAAEDAARVGDAVTDHLLAASSVTDGAVAEDYAPSGEGSGQAWTANNDTWAMSRYAPYTYTQIAVIDDVAYGVGLDGLYALAGGDTPVEAHVVTGKLDIGGAALAHPLQALVACEMDAGATASLTVSTTQSGTAEAYAYPLERRTGAAMGTGRFVFGRGLRGRHFAFDLGISASSASIEDLRIETAQTKRRV